MRSLLLVLAAAAVVLAAGCTPEGPPSPYQALGATAAPVRAAFNANIGKVRIIMLVAPT
jgi:hypothetical protein